MKKATNWKWLVCTVGALCTLASMPAVGQDLDLTVDAVDVTYYAKGDFNVVPYVGLANQGQGLITGQWLEVAIYYGPIMVELARDVIDYVHDHQTCWNYTPNNCGQGECLEIWTFTSNWVGECISWPNFYRCGCKYTITPYVEPVPCEPGVTTMTIVVDPNDLIPETDETNNEMTIDLGAVGDDLLTWSGVKSMYR